MANAIMVMGTASDVGKSVIAAGICRLLYRRGVRIAPFKSQNMSLNSFVTTEGGEMGRAQVLQAQACGLLPHVDMNPILLKPEADNRSQVVVNGTVWGTHDAQSYFGHRRLLFHHVRESYERLAGTYDAIVIEGAGSAAEINLRDRDIVNWPVAVMADAGVVLVADIDRGGVFAQVIGTIDLLTQQERRRIVGIVINKFRGDLGLFGDGVTFLAQRTKIPVLGVVPFFRGIQLDQEDSLDLERCRGIEFTNDKVNVAVVLLPHMSNFTDFNVLAAEPDVAICYAASPVNLTGADVVMLPGSKNTLADLDYLAQAGFGPTITMHVNAGRELIGICGGYQMLGREIADPLGIEAGGHRQALDFLDVVTELTAQKVTRQVEAQPLHFEMESNNNHMVRGYEIHMGRTQRGQASPCFKILRRNDLIGKDDRAYEEGAISADHRVWGTYIHGVFDSPGFRRSWLNHVRKRKGLAALPLEVSAEVSQRLSLAIDRWADHLERHLKLEPIFTSLNLSPRTEEVVMDSEN